MDCRVKPGNDDLGPRCASPHTKPPGFAILAVAPKSFNRAPGSNVMAKGQMRSNKEKKKPKADKNLKKGGAAPVNPFAAGKTPAGQSPNSKKS
jgi:hypothetical protein